MASRWRLAEVGPPWRGGTSAVVQLWDDESLKYAEA